MTENKRFTYMEQFNGFCDVYDKGKILSCMRLEYVERTIKLLNDLHEDNKQLKKENEQLEQRNKRQYNQLNEVWGLIKSKDWETLTEMVKQMEEDEKRLQEEWECYE